MAETLTGGSYTVTIGGVDVTGWQTVTIPGNRTKINSDGVLGETVYDDLVMERVLLAGDTTLHDWRTDVLQGKMDAARRGVAVEVLDDSGTVQIRWEFTNAWPKEYHTLSLRTAADSNAASYDDSATEQVTVVFDSMDRTV